MGRMLDAPPPVSGQDSAAEGAGDWVLDGEWEPAPDPPPVTTIAWRTVHIAAVNYLYWDYAFGTATLTFALDFPSNGADAVGWLAASQPRPGRGTLVRERSMTVTSTPPTLEEFLRLPEEKPALEFADGVVSPKVSPKGKHSALQAELVRRLDEAGRPGKVTRAFTELRTTFAGASRVPDLAVYRWDRIPVDASGQVANEFTEPPDITIEIVSPEQSVNARVRRCLWYVDNGVQLALLVDPNDESVLAFHPDRPASAWRGSDRIDVSEVIRHFELTVDQLFASLRQG